MMKFLVPAAMPDGSLMRVQRTKNKEDGCFSAVGESIEITSWLRHRIDDGDLVEVAQPAPAQKRAPEKSTHSEG